MLKILNEELSAEKLNNVLFAFPPVEIPINEEGYVVSKGEAPCSHYASIVYDVNLKEFAILEYSRKFFHAVASYEQRHGRITDLEVLLTRHPDQKLKMSIGNTDKVNDVLSDNLLKTAKAEYHNNLIEHYKSLNGYRVHDL